MSTPNPYAAPRAPVADAAEDPRNFVPAGRPVPASHGWSWIAEAWDLFKRQPAVWIGIVVVGALVGFGLVFIPVMGWFAATALTPVFSAGIVIGSRTEDKGGDLRLSHLFAGFRERFGTLLSVGLIYLGLNVAMALIAGLTTGAGTWVLVGNIDPDTAARAGLALLLALLVWLALMLPVFMAIWFAAPLVVFHNQGPGEAMKNSFTACLRNVLPFLVYSVIALLLAFIASIPLGLGWLVLGPVMAASLYTGYRDIFFE